VEQPDPGAVGRAADLLVGGLAAGAQEVDYELQLAVAVAGDVTLYLFGALRERQQEGQARTHRLKARP
jgi:hypothetical protein